MSHIKDAAVKYPILELLRKRWSPRAFAEKEVEIDKLKRLFEAARWSASSSNEQPWRYIVGIQGKGEAHARIFNCLSKGNQEWAELAPVLMLIFTKKTFTANEKENRSHQYDAGQATAMMLIQATSDGLYARQMAGVHIDQVISDFQIPDDYYFICAMAIGYLGDSSLLPEKRREDETKARLRKDFHEFVFNSEWGKPFEGF